MKASTKKKRSKMNLNKKELSQSFNVKGIPENVEVDPRNVLLSSNTIIKK